MKIASVRSWLLSYPFPEPIRLPYSGGQLTLMKRDAMLIRVETDNGLVGYAPGPGNRRTQDVIAGVVAPFLEGRSLADPDALRVRFLSGPGRDPHVVRAYCSAEIALYDITGKALGVPVSELIGGRVRDRIRLYASAGMHMPPEAHAAEAAAIAELGFRAYKMRLALGPEGDLEAVRLVREALGPDFDLMVDARAWRLMGRRNYSLQEIEELARGMAEYNIAWLEEPLPPEDRLSYLRLKEKEIIPLAAGANEPDEESYLDLILAQAVDYVQMDVCCNGGYATGRRMFDEIEAQGLRFAFHSDGTALEVLAAAHLGVCWPESVVEWLEYPCYSTPERAGMYPFPLASEILKEPLTIDGGDLMAPRSPGLGIEVDESVVERYPWIPGEWSDYRADFPAGGGAR